MDYLYGNGNKRDEGEYENEIRVGKWITWYKSETTFGENGNKECEKEYKNGFIYNSIIY